MSGQTPTPDYLEAEAQLVAWLAEREGITEPDEAVRAIVDAALEGLVVVSADDTLWRFIPCPTKGDGWCGNGECGVHLGELTQAYPKEVADE